MSASGVRPACRAVRPARGVTPRRLATWLSHAKKKKPAARDVGFVTALSASGGVAIGGGASVPCHCPQIIHPTESAHSPHRRRTHACHATKRIISLLCLHYSRHRLRCIGWLVREHAPAMAKFYFLYSSSTIVTDHRCIPHEFDSRDSKGQCHASTYSLSK
jgi:hypothetical protein